MRNSGGGGARFRLLPSDAGALLLVRFDDALFFDDTARFEDALFFDDTARFEDALFFDDDAALRFDGFVLELRDVPLRFMCPQWPQAA